MNKYHVPLVPTSSLKKNAATIALDAAGLVPGEGDAKLLASIAINSVSTVVSSAQGETGSAALTIGDLIKEPIVKSFEKSGVKLPELIPGLAQLYSGALVARDVWNAAGEYAECF